MHVPRLHELLAHGADITDVVRAMDSGVDRWARRRLLLDPCPRGRFAPAANLLGDRSLLCGFAVAYIRNIDGTIITILIALRRN